MWCATTKGIASPVTSITDQKGSGDDALNGAGANGDGEGSGVPLGVPPLSSSAEPSDALAAAVSSNDRSRLDAPMTTRYSGVSAATKGTATVAASEPL